MSAASSATRWTDVGAVTDIPLRGARRIATPGGDVAVFRTGDGRLFALKDVCPHKGGPLSQGLVHGHAVACPLHNWSIDLATGEPIGPDRDAGCAATAPVRTEGGRVLLGEA
ncbi:MAG: nitrite reductase small subunit NirD [Caulobacteraceae bacterium]